MLAQHYKRVAAAHLDDNQQRRLPVLLVLVLLALCSLYAGDSIAAASSPAGKQRGGWHMAPDEQPSKASASLTALSQAYFAAWNRHDETTVKALFQGSGTLRDWEIAVQGAHNVAAANAKIWSSVPRIRINVIAIHAVSHNTSSRCWCFLDLLWQVLVDPPCVCCSEIISDRLLVITVALDPHRRVRNPRQGRRQR